MGGRRGYRRVDVDTVYSDIRLQQVTRAGERRTARREVGHDRRPYADRDPGRQRRRWAGGARDVRLDRQAVGRVDGDRRYEVEVGTQAVGRRVVQDHAGPDRLLDRAPLVGTRVDAAPAPHDLHGDLGRIERADEAQLGLGRVGGGQTGVDRVDQRRGRYGQI